MARMNKQVGPFAVLLFLVAVFLVLAAVSWLFPPDGIRISEDIRLRFPGPREILTPEDTQYADISHLLEALNNDEGLFLPDTGIVDRHDAYRYEEGEGINGQEQRLVTDTSPHLQPDRLVEQLADDESDTLLTPVAGAGSIRSVLFPLEMPPGEDGVLDGFFSSLVRSGTGGDVPRIIHYGDSQIENNRITSALRQNIQSKFGGSGTGMFPVISPAPHSASVQVITRGNWTRYTPRGRGGERSDHNRYGLLMSYCLAEPAGADFAPASFTLRRTGTGPALSRIMNRLTVFTGFSQDTFVMEFLAGGERKDTEPVLPGDSLSSVTWDLPRDATEFTVRITGNGGVPVFAVSIDAENGVAVDNVPMRGSSGLEFTAADPALMKRMMDILNVRLVILQFGVNVVPDIADDYSWYEDALVRQLGFLKSVAPGASFIVAGVSDMSRRTAGGHYESYPNIELIRDAQRNAAFRSGAAFWDLYEAMGGRNSMPSWVAADPPLGQHDYVHFTFRGSALIGDMLYYAIMQRYEEWAGNPGR